MVGLEDPAKVGSEWRVLPTDSSLDQSYTFYVKATATGGSAFAWSNQLTLHVGCSGPVVFTDDS